MTMILELNDHGIRVITDGEVVLQSPGIAVIEKQQLAFGADALSRCRLLPLQTLTDFWSRLNLDPLDNPHPQVRHHADLVYLHLSEITRQCPDLLGNPVLLVANGHHTAESLPLLLGITKRCGLETIAVVDGSLAITSQNASPPDSSHIEIDMHHALISRLKSDGSQWQVVDSTTVPQCGWIDLVNRLLKRVSQEFLQQTRFNPRHDADTEQRLFNQLLALLDSGPWPDLILLELPAASLQLPAAVLQEELSHWLSPLLKRSSDAETPIWGDRISSLMGLLPDASAGQHLSTGLTAQSLQRAADHLPQSNDGVRYTRQLPITAAKTESKGNPQDDPAATHALFRHHAYSLSGTLSLVNSPRQPLIRGQQSNAMAILTDSGIEPLVEGLTLNGSALREPQPLNQGDQIHTPHWQEALTLITVDT